MKTKNITIALAMLSGLFAGASLFRYFDKSAHPPSAQLKLEEILSIKELHLVKHTYNDLFLLHRKNNSDKPVRVIAFVPVTVTAHLNLKDIKIDKVNDTIRQILLPYATMHDPCYQMGKMRVTKLRAFQLHAGPDLYADVTQYIQQVMAVRIDSVRNVAIQNQILEQAEAEGKEYLESLLKALGRRDVIVTFGNPVKDRIIAAIQLKHKVKAHEALLDYYIRRDTTYYRMDYVAESNLIK